MNVLIVEDEKFDAEELQRRIKTIVSSITIASTAAEAMRQVGASKWDLIVCDVNIPGAACREVIEAIRGIAKCPVLAWTGAAYKGPKSDPDDFDKNNLEPLISRIEELKADNEK